MKCPNCNETLLMTERQRIEIDYCPNCRGIWLDKGELDKLLEQAGNAGDHVHNKHGDSDRFNKNAHKNYQPQHNYRDSDRSSDSHNYPQSRKKKSFLSDLFDFD